MPEFRDPGIVGEIIYPNRTQRVPQGGIDQGGIEDLSVRIAAPEALCRVPSAPECRFCDITVADCPERVETASEFDTVTTDDF